ncbi:OmpA family protein [bacterium]|nr:OmpA family protein [bacterium]
MSDSPEKGEGTDKKSNGSDKLNELRNILFPERAELDSLQEKLNNPEVLADSVSKILPQAVRMRAGRDEDLTQAISGTVEKALRASVRKNPRPLADAIFPIIGPAIRKAISSAIAGLIQSFNQTLEHSLSVRGLQWRWEAIRTGKPFAEVVLLHSLLYRVEQVFLIHRESGLLLQHVSSTSSQSPDLISGMLTAIQDFVKDSFQLGEAETLETMRVGELSVWVEQGPYAILAAVIRGNAPQDLRSILQATLEKIHLEKARALEKFQGDTTTFESIRPELEECLLSQYKKAKQKQSRPGSILLAIIVLGLLLWAAYLIWEKYRVNQFVNRLNNEPGIVITTVEKQGGKYNIQGLRDPLAMDPAASIAFSGLRSDKLVFTWEPYQAIHPQFLLMRANAALNPPDTVTLELDKTVLVARGKAPHRWITESKSLARAITGISGFNDEQLIELEAEEMYTLKKQAEEKVLRFVVGTADLVPGQEQELDAIAFLLARLIAKGDEMGKQVRIEVAGHTDTTGNETGNRELSQARADAVTYLLNESGISPQSFQTIGKASDAPLRPEANEEDREWNRSVTFHLNWSDLKDDR